MRNQTRGACLVVLALFGGQLAQAGDWLPDPNRRYTLEISIDHAVVLTDSDRAWARSLANNLEMRGGTVAGFDIYPLQRQARLLVNGSAAPDPIYEVEPGTRYLSLGHPSVSFLVDFREKAVFAAAGPSFHPH